MPQEHNELALPKDTMLQEYKIESVLGAGTFGMTYLAVDTHLENRVVIKEYLPNDLAVRKESSTVVPKTHSDAENFQWGLDRFLQEAKVLAKFNHPNIVKISRFFHTNDTAYFIMNYEEGQDLDEYLKQCSYNLSEEEIYNIIMPILDGLREVHSTEFLHRDIKPGNIFIRKSGSPMLIDFGASRFAMGAKSKSLSVVLTEGYAPKEQYSSTSKQGAYTDIYAIGAVMYKMATGKVPPESSARADAITDDEPDPYQRIQDMENISYGDNFKKAVDWALEFRGKDRPQSVRELQDVLIETLELVDSVQKQTIQPDNSFLQNRFKSNKCHINKSSENEDLDEKIHQEYNEVALAAESKLQKYRIQSVLGIGAFKITYLAEDTQLHKKVVINEFFPARIVTRTGNNSIVPKSLQDEDGFKQGLEHFVKESKTLTRFIHSNIVKINHFFAANNTAYFVMDYIEGEDLAIHLNNMGRTLSEEEILSIIQPIVDALRVVHSHGQLHRDINPYNIFLKNNGSSVLMGFTTGSKLGMGAEYKSLSVVPIEGYAPAEQYSFTAKQGAYTDLYAVGAVMYKMATDKVPPAPSIRAETFIEEELDSYSRLQDMPNIAYSENFKIAVDWALEFRKQDRPQSAKEFQNALIYKQLKPKESTSKIATDDIITIDGLMYQNTPPEKTFWSKEDKEYTWHEAEKYAKNLRLGGYSDWRLPTTEEIYKIANIELYGEYNDGWKEWFLNYKEKRNKNIKGKEFFLDNIFLENISKNSWLWVDNKENNSSHAWRINFNDGDERYINKSDNGYIRCVR